MDQNANFESTKRRFIFNDDFYNNLENQAGINNKDESNIDNTISIPKVENQVPETKVEEQVQVPVEQPVVTNTKPVIEMPKVENIEPVLDEPKVEEIKDEVIEPVIDVPKVEENNILDTPKIEPLEEEKEEVKVEIPNLGIPTKEEVVEVEVNNRPTFDESLITPINNENDFNVESGIDTSLEHQILKNRDIYQPKQDIVNEYGIVEKPEIVKYRAVRRPRTENNTDNKSINIPNPLSFNTTNQNNINIDNKEDDWQPDIPPAPVMINESVSLEKEEVHDDALVFKSDLIPRLIEKERQTGRVSVLARYGDDFCNHDYVTNPAIGRDNEIKELGLILLTPEKSAILVGKPGIGKTSIVEGLAYRIQRNMVPDALKGFSVVSVKTTSLLGNLTNGETRLQTLIDELKELDKIILFIDEVHMLMGATNDSSLDFANMFKESLGRGSIKMIGATTSDEYERYVLRDKAFVRRFQRVDVEEPTRDQTIQILMGTLPKMEKATGARLKYTNFIKTEIMGFIVDATSEYKRVYGIGSRYPDVCITLVNQAYSSAVFDNRNEVSILDIRNAIEHSKNIYPDVIKKELINFDEKFKDLIEEEKELL